MMLAVLLCALPSWSAPVGDLDFVRCRSDSAFQEGTLATGFLHIGANGANESHIYHDCVGANVLFFECDPDLARMCQFNAAKHGQRCVQACLSNVAERRTFHVADNRGMSSSLLPPGGHAELYPDVQFDAARQLQVETERYDVWKAAVPLGLLPPMNALIVDVQGMEYEVLDGLGAELDAFESLLVEVSSSSTYQGQRRADEVDALLQTKGFGCVASCEPCDHCDRMYRKRSGTTFLQAAASVGSSAAKSKSTVVDHGAALPCAASGTLVMRLPGGARRGNLDVQVPVALAGLASWEALWGQVRPLARDLCETTAEARPPGEGPAAARAENLACAAEIEHNVNGWVMGECPDQGPGGSS